LFDADGCLTDAGLLALTNGTLDELGRLEAAEHLAYCDRCLARYTALPELQEALQAPPRDLTGPVMRGIWARLVQNVYGRVAVAGVAAALALGLWQVGAFDLIFTGSKYLANYT
jgi:anti-sigma factor RsiW